MADDEIRIEVNIDALQEMPLETLAVLERAKDGQLTAGEMIDLFDAFIVGGVQGRFKVKHLKLIANAISTAFQEQTDPGGASAAAS